MPHIPINVLGRVKGRARSILSILECRTEEDVRNKLIIPYFRGRLPKIRGLNQRTMETIFKEFGAPELEYKNILNALMGKERRLLQLIMENDTPRLSLRRTLKATRPRVVVRGKAALPFAPFTPSPSYSFIEELVTFFFFVVPVKGKTYKQGVLYIKDKVLHRLVGTYTQHDRSGNAYSLIITTETV